MKKLLALLLASTLVISTFTACQRKPEQDGSESSASESAGIYKDGTYSANYTVPAQDRTLDYLTVTVQNDEIVIYEY